MFKLIILFSLFAILYYALSLYILNKYYILNKKEENIVISKVWPEFIIKRLKVLETYSKNESLVKEIKDIYYFFILLSFFIILLYILLIFLI